MRIRSSFPRQVREISHTWIPMSDGARLAARIWLPEDAEEHPVPALLEYIPYRKNDATAERDATIHPYFAGHGYASVRVDIRGSGDSDGILHDEYLPQELEDGAEIIAWLAAQPWSTGAVGMFGKSWGGFNALQVAALRPPALKAIISVDSTDDRYADDVHYMGGCLLGSDMLSWASTMLAYDARPPDPSVVGDVWREQWLGRLEANRPFVETWVEHQRRDDYWKHGSVGEDFSAIDCAVYMIGGWADPYHDAVLRVLEGYDGPRKGLIGPWAHEYPHRGVPGPATGFLQDALRWWDHWLKGEETGIMDEPQLRVWLQEWDDPSATYEVRSGRWIAEASWPSPRIAMRTFALGDGTLRSEPQHGWSEAPRTLTIRGAQEAGLATAGAWLRAGVPGEHPTDQRGEDARSLCFDSDALGDAVDVVGMPELHLRVAADRRFGLVAARLCDVSPDGSSLLVTRGLLDLTHRDSHEDPEPLEPGRPYDVRLRLGALAHRFEVGHRIRLAISPTYFPWAWPSPEPVTLEIDSGKSRLELPVRPERPEDAELAPFEPAEAPPPLEVELLDTASGAARTISHDLVTRRHELVVGLDHFGTRRIVRDGLVYAERGQDMFSIVEGEPLSASARSDWRIELERDDWRVRIETSSTMTSDATDFILDNALVAFEGDERVFARTWSKRIARDLA
jgi:putative CocE/NonD family hydrolase